MDKKVKDAISEMKRCAHEIGSRNLPPHLKASITHKRSGGYQPSADFDVDEFLERQKLLEKLAEEGTLEELLKA